MLLDLEQPVVPVLPRIRNGNFDPAGNRAGFLGNNQDQLGKKDRFGDVVRDEHDGLAGLLPDAQQLGAHLPRRDFIQAAERLVHQENVRLGHESAGNGDALLHPPRQLQRIVVLVSCQTGQLQLALRPLFHLIAVQGFAFERQDHIALHRTPVQQAGFLEHEAYFEFSQVAEPGSLQSRPAHPSGRRVQRSDSGGWTCRSRKGPGWK